MAGRDLDNQHHGEWMGRRDSQTTQGKQSLALPGFNLKYAYLIQFIPEPQIEASNEHLMNWRREKQNVEQENKQWRSVRSSKRRQARRKE